MRTRFIIRTLLLLTLLLVAAGCRNSAQEASTGSDVNIALEVTPDPATVGATVLTVILTDANGNFIVDAERVAVRGDMNHAGMEPVFGVAEEAANGRYRVPFEWTMGGDWILSITVELPGDREIKQDIELSVNG